MTIREAAKEQLSMMDDRELSAYYTILTMNLCMIQSAEDRDHSNMHLAIVTELLVERGRLILSEQVK